MEGEFELISWKSRLSIKDNNLQLKTTVQPTKSTKRSSEKVDTFKKKAKPHTHSSKNLQKGNTTVQPTKATEGSKRTEDARTPKTTTTATT